MNFRNISAWSRGVDTELFAEVVHTERMYSLDNAFSREELDDWAARVDRGLGRAPIVGERRRQPLRRHPRSASRGP